MSKSCDKCGQNLPSEMRVDWSAIPRAIKKLRKEIGFGVNETHKRNNRKLTNNKKTKRDRK